MNGSEIVPYTQPDMPPTRHNDGIMVPANIALDKLVNDETGDSTRDFANDTSMDIDIYEDVFEIVCNKRKLAATTENCISSSCNSSSNSSSSSSRIYLAFNLMHFVKNVVQMKCDVVYTKKKLFMYGK